MKGRMKNNINVKGSGEMRRWGKERGWRSSGEMKRYGREKCWRSVNVKLKKNIKKNYKKMERKKIMSWMLTWLNVSAAALNVTFQLLVIYRYRYRLYVFPHTFSLTRISKKTENYCLNTRTKRVHIHFIVIVKLLS